MTILPSAGVEFDFAVPVLIIGAGACGLTAALAASDAGATALVLERDKVPRGNTALSGGMIPAACTRVQRENGVADSVDSFVEDIRRKTGGHTDMGMAAYLAEQSGGLIDWLQDAHGLNLVLCTGLRYPGQSVERMHGSPGRTGADLHNQLMNAVAAQGVEIVTQAHVTALFADDDRRIGGVEITRPDGSTEQLGCDTLILACNGFGGSREMVAQFIPQLIDAPYFGHQGNVGDAVKWGTALGGAVADMGSFQGHGAFGDPSGVGMWHTITVNGIQVNLEGHRFADESSGYSEQALKVLAQPNRLAWNIFDQRGYDVGMTHDDFRNAVPLGVVKQGNTPAELARATGLPADALTASITAAQAMARGEQSCPFGRDFTRGPGLEPVFYATRVTGAFLHTQGGLVVDQDARVLDQNGGRLPNLFAGGGAARSISGPGDAGYLSGNGLLTATVLGRSAGTAAARLSGADAQLSGAAAAGH